MIFIKRYYKLLICLLLCAILGVGCILVRYLNNPNTTGDTSRRIDVEQKSNLEQAQIILEKFNHYETDNTETSIGFSGEMFASVGEILGFDSLSYQEEEVTKKFDIRYDFSTNSFKMAVSYYSGDILLETFEHEAEPFYDEERDDGYLLLEGERFYFSEYFNTEGLDECVATVAVIGAGAVLVCGIIIILAITQPDVIQQITQSVTYVVQTIVQIVQTFWSWFTSWITQIVTKTVAVITTTTTTIKTPTLSIDGTKYQTKAMTQSERLKLPKTAYYLAFADPTNNKIYLSTVNIKSSYAAAIMASPMAQNCIANTSYQMIASVFTLYNDNAKTVMDMVGYNLRTPRDFPEADNGIYHYHSKAETFIKTPGSPYGSYFSPHMFFELWF